MYLYEDRTPTHYPGFWIRFVAYFIDQIIIYFGFIILLALFTGDPFYQYRLDPMNPDRDYWLMTSSSFIFQLLYYSGLESSSRQATLGKMIMGIKVVGKEGERISLRNAFGRYLGKILSALIFLIGYIMAAFDQKKQALHDKLASTYVVYG